MSFPRKSLLVVCCFISALSAQEESATNLPEPKEKTPPVEKIGETAYRLGGISFDSETREIRVPTVVNMRDGGPLEYVLVHEGGKVHESLLATPVSAFNLKIVLKLLRYREGMGDVLAPMLPEDERAVALTKRGERGEAVEMTVEWQEGEETKTAPVEDWIADGKTQAAVESDREDAHWVHTGSYFSDAGGFLAEVEGSIVGLYLDRVAIFNTPLEGSENDERWGGNGLATPPLETEVTLIIKPRKMSQSDSSDAK